jgi:hypothetical protein
MLRQLIAFVGTFVALGVGNFVTIILVKRLDAPLLVFPAVLVIMALTAAIWWVTALPGLTAEEKLRRLSQ